jgi:hypothetical protein
VKKPKLTAPDVHPAKAGVFSGKNPTGVKVRSPVAWITGGKETELLKLIDEAIY